MDRGKAGMRYYKRIEGQYIAGIGTGAGGTEITQEEYDSILQTIHSRPALPDGYGCRLTTDMNWVQYALPAVEEEVDEATALAELMEVLG